MFNTESSEDSLPRMGPNRYHSMPPIQVTANGVAKLMRNLQPHKTTGPDNVPARLLKETSEDIAPALILLFQASINQRKVRQDWKYALVFPIFKLSNYRPASITAICCKLLEQIIHSSIMKHLDHYIILT